MKSSGIGGQAVIEGVMMKNKDKYAVAVRKPDNEIEVVVNDCNSLSDKNKIFKLPIIRGVVNFVDSLVTGMKTLTYSASFFEDEEDEDKSDKTDNNSEKKVQENIKQSTEHNTENQESDVKESVKENKANNKPAKAKNPEVEDKKEKVIMAGTVALSIVMAVAIFMVLPYFISRFFSLFVKNETVLIILEGIIRVSIFIIYVKLISLLDDIKRVYMYHGAEHKCINCIEHGLELTVENVMKSSKEHKRCGTSFMLIVMCISIIFFMFIRVDSPLLRLLLRIVLVPVIAGVSYEVLKLAGNTDSKFMDLVSRPGLMLQHLTTSEPDESMVEVAIASVEAVFDWRSYIENLKKEEK